MTAGRQAVVLHNQVSESAGKDDTDVLVQADAVQSAMEELGWGVKRMEFTLDLLSVARDLESFRPRLVFNLVESAAGDGRLIHLAPSLLDHLQIPYSGCPCESLFVTSSKLLTKRSLHDMRLATPGWLEADGSGTVPQGPLHDPFIVKSVWEHGSSWFNETSLVYPATREELLRQIRERNQTDAGEFFAERYIAGREFNVSVLEGRVMPVPEMIFRDFPAGKLPVLDFRSKWEDGSFEYQNTLRRFDFPPVDVPLIRKLERISLNIWKRFSLRGYARVDFRVDPDGRPWILEINANPCLSPDAGFFAACNRAGFSYIQMVQRIIEAALSLSSQE